MGFSQPPKKPPSGGFLMGAANNMGFDFDQLVGIAQPYKSQSRYKTSSGNPQLQVHTLKGNV